MNYQLLTGDSRTVLRTLAPKSVHAIITSPPYFNLRSYSGEQDVDWEAFEYAPMPGLPPLSIPAWRGGLGNEPTIEMYIGHLVLCLREWWRVLRDDGCAFVNLGDSFAGSGGAGGDYNAGGIREGQPKFMADKAQGYGIKAKDLYMVPARFALAAQADGWYVRSRIIWAKGVSFLADYAGSCMPESVTDRPTKSDEDIYLLTKQPKYFWDNEAVKEPSTGQTGKAASFKRTTKDNLIPNQSAMQHRTDRSDTVDTGGRSLRSVWVINPQGYDGAHFAVWPPALVAPMIKAATSEHGVCGGCGAPWARVVEKQGRITIPRLTEGDEGENSKMNGPGAWNAYITTGWQPTCTCNAAIVPATVLDPFGGSGTTAATACALGRNAISIDISTDYIQLQEERIAAAINDSGRAYVPPTCKPADFADMPLFAEVTG
jgi:DNA modification methylase